MIQQTVKNNKNKAKYVPSACDIVQNYGLDNLYAFKHKDYMTVLIGRYDKNSDSYYVQRGDGSCYFYARVEWSVKLEVKNVDR